MSKAFEGALRTAARDAGVTLLEREGVVCWRADQRDAWLFAIVEGDVTVHLSVAAKVTESPLCTAVLGELVRTQVSMAQQPVSRARIVALREELERSLTDYGDHGLGEYASERLRLILEGKEGA